MLFFSIHTSRKLSRLHPPPSKQNKWVWMKRMNIHEIFMTVKVSGGTSAGLAFELGTSSFTWGLLENSGEIARSPPQWCPRWGINQIKAFMISEQRSGGDLWPITSKTPQAWSKHWKMEVGQVWGSSHLDHMFKVNTETCLKHELCQNQLIKTNEPMKPKWK